MSSPATKRSKPSYVLGIDAGGTKTAAAVGSLDELLGQAKSGPGNMKSATPAKLQAHFRKAVKEALKSAKLPATTQFSVITVGMSGIDTTKDAKTAKRIAKQALSPWISSSTTLTVVNDVHIVRRSGSKHPFGIGLIAGTGANGYGTNKRGDEAYVSGLGKELTDEGSGYWIGMKALQSAVRSADGRIKPTRLQAGVFNSFKVSTARELLLTLPNKTKADIAELSWIIEDLAAEGDWRATQILEEALDELVLNTATLVKRLRLKTVAFDIVVVGGMFNMPKYPFLKKFKRRIKTVAPKAIVIYPDVKPVIGALYSSRDQIDA